MEMEENLRPPVGVAGEESQFTYRDSRRCYGFLATRLGISKVHVPPKTRVLPNVWDEALYSCSYLKNIEMSLMGRMNVA
jgi:hypothetical protein